MTDMPAHFSSRGTYVIEDDGLVDTFANALRLLADFIDQRYPGDSDPVAQESLRRVARGLDDDPTLADLLDDLYKGKVPEKRSDTHYTAAYVSSADAPTEAVLLLRNADGALYTDLRSLGRVARGSSLRIAWEVVVL